MPELTEPFEKLASSLGGGRFLGQPGKLLGPDADAPEEEELDEKTLTPAEMKKREEVAKAIKRENPNMPMSKKMAIATATAKKVAEETEELTEDEELTHLLNIIYENLSDENKEIFEEILEEDPDQMIEFLEQLELESDNG